MTNLLSPTLSKLAQLRQSQINIWKDNPIQTQRQLLQDIITNGQFTQFGRKYNFSNINSIKQFKIEIPINDYENILPYVDQMMQGKENILWNTPVNWFAKSSGTTSKKSKFIPITEEVLQNNHYLGAKDVLTMYYSFNPYSDLLTGKGLVVGGSHQINIHNEDIRFGDLSAVLLENAPFWGQWLRTPELSIAIMDNWEEKIERLAQTTIKENVSSISGVPTWTLILLKRILEVTGKNYICDVWPSLELYIHGGVSFEPYRKSFETIIGKPIHYIEIYNASEGFFAAQENPNDDGMLLLVEHGIFYEFMPISEYGNENPKTIGLDKVELNKVYAPVITTVGGLWRYVIGDTIKFTGLNPFRIKVVGRLKHFINAFGEEVMVDNTDKALSITCHKFNCSVVDYTAAPVYFSNHQNGAHEWLIEFDKEPENLEAFANELDIQLQEQNSDYEAKRFKNIALRRLQIKSLPKGTFNNWLAKNNKLGGQHKVPRLSNDRTLIEELIRLI